MAVKDFKASQIRTTQIIASGSIPGKPSILIASASSPGVNFEGAGISNATLMGSVGSDVFMFVSGSKNTKTDVTVFGGDVVISGTMYAETVVMEVDEAVTGSFSISGSLAVSGSSTLRKGLTVNAAQGVTDEHDFTVFAEDKKAIFVDATGDAAGSVALLTNHGTSETITVTNTLGSTDGSDDAGAIELSAAAGGIGLAWSDSKTLWAEGGDVMIVANENKSDAIKLHADAGSSQTISVINDEGTSESAIKIEAGAGGVDIDAAAGKNVTIAGGQVSVSGLDDGVNSVSLGTSAGTSTTVAINNVGGTSENSININSTAGGIDINAASTKDISLNAGQVLINSGGAAGSPNEANGTDIGFFVSGAIGSRDAASGDLAGGLSLFGGDTLVSGSLFADNLTGSITKTSAGTSFLAAGSNVTITSGSSGQVVIAAANPGAVAGSNQQVQFNDAGSFGGDAGLLYNKATDTLTAGNINVLTSLSSSALTASVVIPATVTNSIQITSGTTRYSASDTFFFVSGSVGINGSKATEGISVFGGDAEISGSLYADQISGSLTHLTDGTSYLIAGSNVTITSASSGGVTIASSGGGTPGGSNTQVQFNDGGSFGGDSTLVFNKTSNTLGVENLGVTEGLSVVGAISGTMISPGGGDNSVQIISGSTKYTALDTFFFVSGNIGLTGKASSGVTLFGGDTEFSGSLFAEHISGSLTHLSDGTSYIVAGDNVTVTSQSNGSIIIAATAGGGGGSTDVGWVASGPDRIDTTGSLGVSGTLRVADAIQHIGETGNKISFATGQVLILSGGAAGSENPAAGTDVGFFVSGAIGSRGAASGDLAKGLALFGGDVVASGTLVATDVTIGDDLTVGDDALFTSDGAKLSFGADAEVTLTHVHNTGLLLSDDSGVGTTKLMLGDSATFIQQQADGQLGIDADSIINITAPTVDIDASTEVNVSGQATVAGTLLVAEDIQHNGDTDTKVTFEDDKVSITAGGVTGLVMQEGSSDVLMLGSNGTQAGLYSQVLILSGGAPGSPNESAGGDVVFFVSGAVGGKGSAGTSVFGGDVCTSGTLYPSEIKTNKISGSLTRLSDGSSYLIAGSNVTITSASNGSVTVASSGGGSVAGSDTQVQFNDGGSMAGDAGLVFNKTTDTLTAGTLSATTLGITGGGTVAALSSSYIVPASAKNEILITSGNHVAEATGNDVFLYVTGTVGTQGTTTKGTSLFAGDLVTSGTLLATDVTIGDDLTVGDDALFTSDGAKLSFGADAEVTLTHVHNTGLLLSDDSGVGTTKLMFGDAATFIQQQADAQLGIDADSIINITAPTVDIDASTEVNISGQTTVAGTLLVAADIQHNGDTDTKVSFDTDKVSISAGGVTGLVMQEGSSDVLMLGSNGTQAGLYNQVLILSGGAAGSPNESAGGDVVFFVSGAVGGKGSAGTSVFGGDVCTSGTLYPSEIKTNKISGSLTRLVDGSSYLVAGDNITVTSASNGAVTIAGGSGVSEGVGWIGSGPDIIDTTGSLGVSGTLSVAAAIQHIGETGNKINFTSGQVLFLSGGAAGSTNEGAYTDINFYVSGTAGSAGSTTKGSSLFGGDVVASGSLLPGTDLGSDLGSASRRFANIYTGDLHLRNERGDWTIVEEPDYLCVINNRTNTKYKMVLEPLEE